MSSSDEAEKPKRKRRSDEIRELIRQSSGVDGSGKLGIISRSKHGIDNDGNINNDGKKHKDKRRDRYNIDRYISNERDGKHGKNHGSGKSRSSRVGNKGKEVKKYVESSSRKNSDRRRSSIEDRDDDVHTNQHREGSVNITSRSKVAKDLAPRSNSRQDSRSPRRWSPSPSPTAPKRRHSEERKDKERARPLYSRGDKFMRERSPERVGERREKRRSHSRDSRSRDQHNLEYAQAGRSGQHSEQKLKQVNGEDGELGRKGDKLKGAIAVDSTFPTKSSSSASKKSNGKPSKKGKRDDTTKLLSFDDDMAGDGSLSSAFQVRTHEHLVYFTPKSYHRNHRTSVP